MLVDYPFTTRTHKLCDCASFLLPVAASVSGNKNVTGMVAAWLERFEVRSRV